jgi:hypothetical protein
VCPQDSRFSGSTPEAQLLELRYGKVPFVQAQSHFSETMKGLMKSGLRGIKTLTLGYAARTPVPENESGVKEIIHVNTSGLEGTDLPIEEIVANSLDAASLSQNIETVALPLIGDISTPDMLRQSLQGSYLGVQRHLETIPGTPIKEVRLVVNAGEEVRPSLENTWASIVDSDSQKPTP